MHHYANIDDELNDLNRKARITQQRYALELLEVELGIERNRRPLNKKAQLQHGLYGKGI